MRKVVYFIIKFFAFLIQLGGQKFKLRFYHLLGEQINMVIKNKDLFFAASEEGPYSRGINAFSAEKDTIFWLDNYVNDGDVLFDVGANIGVFSIYAGKCRKAKVYAFEPESANYCFLNRNIFLNDLGDNITAYNVAINDDKKMSYIALSGMGSGKALHQFDNTNTKSNSKFLQGCVGITIDELIKDWGLPVPRHIKIDVDGNEHRILKGMKELLKNPYLHSIAIELDQIQAYDIDALQQTILDAGFEKLIDSNLVNENAPNKGMAYNRYFLRTDRG